MDLFNLIKTRRSIRKYKTDDIPKEMVEKVLEAGIWAPSSLNRQPWRFIVVTGEKRVKLTELAKTALQQFLETEVALKKYGQEAVGRFKTRAAEEGDRIFYDAPAVIMVIQTKDTGSELDYGLAIENMMLYAHSEELGMCPIGLAIPMNESQEAREFLGLKLDEKIELGLCLGYPDETPGVKERNFEVVEWLE